MEYEFKKLPTIAALRHKQGGGLTLFTAVMVLILMTLMLFYAARVGVFEQRTSANDMRQKVAFNAADAMLDQAIEYLFANAQLVLSSGIDILPDSNGDMTRDGWFASGLWVTCSATQRADNTHPCGGTIAPVPNSTNFWYYADPATGAFAPLPVATTGLAANSTARVTAILCFIDSGSTTCDAAAPVGQEEEGDKALVLSLLAYGYADCTDITDPGTCQAEATIAKPISSFSNLSGSPSVPLVTKSTFPPTGTAEVVGNPNGGGVGVALTTWINDNPACSPATNIEDSGSWQTCELQDWYHTDEYPEGVACTDNNCLCGPGGNDTSFFLSWKHAQTTQIGVDIVIDPVFPCDLFDFYFGYPKTQYNFVKATATILSDCSSLGPHSSGLIWISGATCRINANTIVGSPNAPVLLVSAASETILAGGATIFGVLYIFDGEDIDATLTTLGNATVYGSAIVDAEIDSFQGTFQIVHADGVLADAASIGGFGNVSGGWRDFGLPDLSW
jgi:hypothetical protein